MLDKEFHIRFTLADVGKAVCFAPVLVGFIYLLICLLWISNDPAAWVQAVGSVLAIFVAIWVFRRETESRRDEQFKTDHRYMTKAHAFASYSAINVGAAADYIATGRHEIDSLDYWATVLGAALEDMAQVDVMRFENEKVVHAFLAIKQAAFLSQWTIKSYLAGNLKFNGVQVSQWKPNVECQLAAMEEGILAFVQAYPRMEFCT